MQSTSSSLQIDGVTEQVASSPQKIANKRRF